MALDAGWAGVLGSLFGILGTLATSCLTHKLQNKRANTLAETRRDKLRRELKANKYTWRSIERLSSAIGADESTTAELLIEIGARASRTDKNVWALESRAPYPEEKITKDK